MVSCKNISSELVIIDDLGLLINQQQTVSLSEMFESQQYIIDSEDLYQAYLNNKVILYIDNEEKTFDEVKSYIQSLTERSHESLDTLVHDLHEQLYFESIKENGATKAIIYYKDNSKALKVREEEIIRDSLTKRVESIIVRQYDENENVVSTSTEIIHRNSNQTVSNIEVVV